ncbi:TetR/AcrR family transcriptional regulator [Allokutzneria sp. NRRL B-24872]|uniref:TetR/AcrR family transcriptional regulator n=1 Tax=Allokutzneria sp. NRRL B-24872 TaxID=1137961 RepID=UPI000A37AFAB|nr:TetR/AcrR family transcriptional regulator [Allokutzneria sp. NRRL B-24872]
MSTTRAKRRSASETRELVLEVAHELFYWNGIHAVGVDRVASAAGIAPTTLYRLFASKDELVTAYVERAVAAYQAWFSEVIAADGRDARTRVLALFDALVEQVRPDQCRGCPYLMALTEFPDPQFPAHRAAVAVKQWVRDRFGDLAEELGARDPAALADRLALIMEGTYASVQALGLDGPVRETRAFAESLLPQ